MNAGLGHLLHGSGLRNVVPAHRSAQYRLYSALAYYNTGKYRCMSVDLVALLVPLVCDRVFRFLWYLVRRLLGFIALGCTATTARNYIQDFQSDLLENLFLFFFPHFQSERAQTFARASRVVLQSEGLQTLVTCLGTILRVCAATLPYAEVFFRHAVAALAAVQLPRLRTAHVWQIRRSTFRAFQAAAPNSASGLSTLHAAQGFLTSHVKQTL